MPMENARALLPDCLLMTILTAALFLWCKAKGRMTKPMGAAGLAAYLGYMAWLIVNA